jgi:hypothetical protein
LVVTGPAVVHNNFLIGLDVKRMRFARYGLWTIGDSVFTSPNPAGFQWAAQCGYDPLAYWRSVFEEVHKNARIPTITLGLPVHDSNYPEGATMVQVGTEGLANSTAAALLHVENDPPSYLDFQAIGVYQGMPFCYAFLPFSSPLSLLSPSPVVSVYLSSVVIELN